MSEPSKRVKSQPKPTGKQRRTHFTIVRANGDWFSFTGRDIPHALERARAAGELNEGEEVLGVMNEKWIEERQKRALHR